MVVTLDTNCLIDLEAGDAAVSQLRELHESGHIELAIPAIGASERQRVGGYAPTFEIFEARVAALFQRSPRLLRPMMLMDVCFIDCAVICDEEMVRFTSEIHRVLFPGHPADHPLVDEDDAPDTRP